jgi:phage-related protein/uncharacterized coiled-coil DUF342 family protein
MAEHSDGSIVIDTELDQSGFEAGSKELLQAIQSLTSEIKQLNAQFGSAFANTSKAADDSSSRVQQLEAQVTQLQSQVDGLNTALENMENQMNSAEDSNLSGAFDTTAAKQSVSDLQKDLDSLTSDLSKLESSADKAMGVTTTPLERFNELADSMQQRIDDLSDKLEELADSQVPTDDYAWTTQEIQKAETELDKLMAKQDKMDATGVKHSSKAYQNLQYDIDQTKRKIEDLRATQQILTDNGEDFVSGVDTEQYAQYSAQLEDVQAKYDDLCAEVDKFFAKNTSVFSVLGKMIGSAFTAAKDTAVACIQRIAGEVKDLAGRSVSLLADQVKKAVSSFVGLNKGSKSANAGFGTSLKTILKYTFGIRSLFVLVNKLRAALVAGFGNLAQYSSSTNKAISSITSALTQLKNSLALAFDPILQAAAPALTYLISKLVEAISYIGMFTAALSGQKVYKKATSIQEDYAKSLDKTSKSAKDAKRQLASFDELNVLSDKSTKKDDGSVDPSQMFEEVPIDTSVTDFVDRLKKAFADGDFTGLGRIIGEKINAAFQSIKDFIDWDNVGGTITKWVNALCDTINSMVDTIDWDLIGSTFASGVNTIVNTMHLLLTGIDWENIGKAIATGLNAAIRDIDWAKLGQTLGEYFEAKLDVLHGVITNFNWRGLGAAIGTALTNTFAAINWGKAGETLSSYVKGLLDTFSSAVENFDWFALGEDIRKFLVGIDWGGVVGSAVEAFGAACGAIGSLVIGFLKEPWEEAVKWWKDTAYEDGQFSIQGLFEGIKKAFSNVGTWVMDNIFKPLWNGICSAFDIHSPSKKMAELGGYIMEGLKNGITGGITAVVNAIKDLPGNIVTKLKSVNWIQQGKDIIGNIYNGFVAMKDKLPTAIKTIGDNVVTKLKGIDWLAAGKAVIGFIYNGFVALQTKLPDALKTIGNNAVTKLKGIDWLTAGKAVIGFIYNGFVALQTKIPAALKTIGDSAKKKFTDIDWLGVGKNVILGIYNGIQNTLKRLSEAAGKASNWLINAFKDALGIHSPSTEGAELGYWFDAGVAQGIANNSGLAEDAAGDLGLAVYTGADDALDGKGTLLGEGFVDETVDALKNNMDRISNALSSGDGLTNIKGIIDAVQSGDWATVAKNVALGLFNSMDKNFRTNVTGFVADSLEALNKGYEEQGYVGMAKAAWNIISGLKNNLSTSGNTNILVDAGKGMANSITDGVNGGLPDLWTLISSIPGKILELLSGGFGQLKQWGGQFIDWLTNLFKGGSGSIQTNTGNMLQNIGNTFKNFFNGTSQNGSSFIQNLGNTLKNGLGNIQNNSSGLLNGIKNLFSNGFNNIASNAGNLWNSVKGFFSNGLSGVASNAGSMLSNIGSVFSNGFSNIASGASGLFSKLGSLFSGGLSGIASTVGGGLSSIAGSVSSTLGGIASTVGGGLGALASGAAGVAGTIGTTLSGAVATAGTALGGLGTTLAGLATAGGPVGIAIAGVGALGVGLVTAYNKCDWFRNGVNNAFNSIKNTVSNVCKGVGNVVSGMWDGAKNVVSGAVNVGKNIVTGIGNGIKNVASGLWNGVKKVGSGIVNGFKSFFGIHSPSRLMRDEIGEMLPPGIENGIVAATPDLVKGTQQQMEKVVDAAQSTLAQADTSTIGSETPTLDYTGNVVSDKLDGMLSDFSSKIEDSFTTLIDRLNSIADRVAFVTPQAATGTVMPYDVAAKATNGGTATLGDTITSSNEELGSVVIQSVTNATSAIVDAIQKYSGTTVNLDANGITDMVIKEINRRTRAQGSSPLIG